MSGLTTIAALPSAGGCRSEIAADRCDAPGQVGSPHHRPDDGRGAREVYVDGVLARMCLEAHTAEGWAIVIRSERPGEFSPGGVTETLWGKVEVFPSGTKGPGC